MTTATKGRAPRKRTRSSGTSRTTSPRSKRNTKTATLNGDLQDEAVKAREKSGVVVEADKPLPRVTANLESSLTEAERNELHLLEQTIEKGLAAFVETGTALLNIRERRLYRDTHQTFEAYCLERWGFGASRARQLIAATKSVTSGNATNARTEREARRLAREGRGAKTKPEPSGDQPLTIVQMQDIVQKHLDAIPRELTDRASRGEATFTYKALRVTFADSADEIEMTSSA